MSTLYIVATPIGNLEDITIRAIKTLNAVDLVLCEDTRVTKKLLDRHNIHTPTLSYHNRSTPARVEQIMAMIKEGKTLALVSDAGTPGISDPGSELVRRARVEFAERIENGELRIEAIPGPSALTAAISIAGIPTTDFTFLGFMPHKKGRETLFKEMAASECTTIFYESPHRILKTLAALTKYLDSEKRVIVCRELTKVFEELVSGKPEEVKNYFEAHKDKIRGEIVVIVAK